MVTIKLDSEAAEDVRLVQELKRMGVPDDVIQMTYNETIKRREQEVKEHTQRMAWVPCTEKLPADERPVLAYTGYANSPYGFISIISYFAHDSTPHWQYSGLLRPDQEVLYWMPLPEPPTYMAELTTGKTKEDTKGDLEHLDAIKDILGDTYDLDRLRELVESDKLGRCVILGVKPDLRPGVNVSRCFIVDDDGEIIEDNVFSAEVGPDSSGKMNVIYNTFDSGDFEEGEVGHRVFWDENSAKKASEASGKRDM